MDKMTYEGKLYDLATYKINIAQMIEAAEESSTMMEAYKNQLDVVITALGEDTVKGLLGSIELDEIDLVTLVVIYNAVTDGYEKRIDDARQKKADRTMKELRQIAGDVKTISSAVNVK